ncbi:hypothetical protein AAY473_034942 [Plecturocebus cupreus]
MRSRDRDHTGQHGRAEGHVIADSGQESLNRGQSHPPQQGTEVLLLLPPSTEQDVPLPTAGVSLGRSVSAFVPHFSC